MHRKMNLGRYTLISAVVALPTLTLPALDHACLGQNQVELIPRRVFFGNPDRTSVRISPDGSHLSYLAPHQGVLNVWVENLDGTGARPATQATKRPIRRYFWRPTAMTLSLTPPARGWGSSVPH